MALRFGLPLRDMEMVQFHPTGLLAGEHTRMTGTVLEEGLRGAGGYLLNGDGLRFMFDYDADGERATRDIVSRAMYAEIHSGHTTPNGGLYISMSHLGPESVRGKFKGMVKRCADCGFDLAGGRVEVVPTAHYFMGGLICDTDTATERPGLFVAGEDAGGAHGANRLGGNGVANSTVYGGVAGEAMARYADKHSTLAVADSVAIENEISRVRHPFSQPAGDINSLRERLMSVMWDNVGVMRTANDLKTGIGRIAELKAELLNTGLGNDDMVFNPTWHDWLNLRSLLEISEVIAAAALSRENSRGAHYREDFTDAGDLDSSSFTVARQSGNSIDITTEPVRFTLVSPGQTLIGDTPADG